MSATTSATTGRRYGLQRVCRAWERSRSALYARRAQAERRRQGDVPARRGPKPLLSDEQLLAAIRADLARSPFQGEGHRKVHARLRLLDGIRVAQTQVLRVMRTQGLLSPHRGRQGDPKLHDGTIITLAPQVMWGTDGVRVFTVDDGWVWTFAAVDHWNAECVGWHVCKVGSRFAALEPIAQGLRRIYGTVDADVARGLALRMDHGSQYLSDHFLRADPILGHPSQLRLPRGTGNEWRRGTVESHAQGASNLRPGLSEPRRRARRRRRVRRAVQSELAPREARISDADRSARGVRATPGRVVVNVCPRNRVRYTYIETLGLVSISLVAPLMVLAYVTFRTAMGRIADANKHLLELNKLYLSTIETLAMAIDAKDQITHGHVRRVQAYAIGLAREIGIEEESELKAIEAAALLHDMGKLAIPEHILNKPGKLTPAEFETMKRHADIGADILSSIDFPYPVVPIVRYHHENWNGRGYSAGLKGDEIPIGARILSVVDCFDALTSDRPYRPRLSDSEALEILHERAGVMYDPSLVDTFSRIYRKIAPADAELTSRDALSPQSREDPTSDSIGSDERRSTQLAPVPPRREPSMNCRICS